MKLETKFLLVGLLSLALAVPIAHALGERGHQNSNLQNQLNSTKKELQLKNSQLKKTSDDNADLQKQLQTKRDTQAKLAATVTPPAAAAPASTVSQSGNCSAYRDLVAQYDWPVETAMAIMHAESGCNPTASSPTCDHGLMQINCVHRAMVGGDLTALNDPATNIRIAYAIYAGRGNFNDWTTFTSGAYLRYL